MSIYGFWGDMIGKAGELGNKDTRNGDTLESGNSPVGGFDLFGEGVAMIYGDSLGDRG